MALGQIKCAIDCRSTEWSQRIFDAGVLEQQINCLISLIKRDKSATMSFLGPTLRYDGVTERLIARTT